MKVSSVLKFCISLMVVNFFFSGCESEEAVQAKSYRLKKQDSYNASNTLTTNYEYQYDSNKVHTTTLEYSGTALSSTATHYYDINGRRTKTANTSGSYSTYTYDAKGVLSKQEEYSSAGALTSYSVITSDSSGKWTKLDLYSTSNTIVQYKTYSYNTTGKRSASTTYNSSGTVIINTEYSYDDKGNLATVKGTYVPSSSYNYTRKFTYEEAHTPTRDTDYCTF